MEKESVFQFADPIDFLKCVFEKKRAKNKRFSLRAWARQLGYNNPSFLSHVLNRRRKLSVELSEKICANLNLSEKGKKYFELLVLLKNSRTEEERKLYLGALAAVRSSADVEEPSRLAADLFQMISEWHHTALLQIVKLRDFRSDFEYMAKRLGGGLSQAVIAESIERLIRLGLLVKNEEGQIKRPEEKSLLIDSQVPSQAIRKFHEQMIGKAKDAIEGQEIGERDLRSSTITIQMSQYPQVQEIIRRAHSEILNLSGEGLGEEIYQLNTQFFRLTNKEGQL